MTLAKFSSCVLVKTQDQYLQTVKNEFLEDTEFENKITGHFSGTFIFSLYY